MLTSVCFRISQKSFRIILSPARIFRLASACSLGAGTSLESLDAGVWLVYIRKQSPVSLSVKSEQSLKKEQRIMRRSAQSGLDSHVSFNVFSGPISTLRAPAGKRKAADDEEKMSTLSQLSSNMFLIGYCFDFKI